MPAAWAMKRKLGFLAAVCAATVNASSANAVTFSGSSGSHAASVDFTIVGGQLQVVLSNTSSADAVVPTDVLTAVFFNISGSPSLSRVSATLAAGSIVFNGPNGGGNVGGEWAYQSGLGGPASYGISSS